MISAAGAARRAKRAAIGLLATCALAASGAQSAAAAPADLDRSFGGDGIVAVESSAPISIDAPAKMAIGLEDEIFVLYSTVGACSSIGSCQVDWLPARFDRDGNRDPQFAVGGGSSLSVQGTPYHPADIAVAPDGKPVVAAIEAGQVVVGRFDRAGHLDGSFGGTGRVVTPTSMVQSATGTPPVVAVQADGKVVVAFEGSTESVSSGLLLVRFNPDGTLDSGFGSSGVAAVKLGTQSRPSGLLLGTGGAISVGVSECCRGEGGQGLALGFARFLSSGGLDAGWAGTGHFSLLTAQPSTVRSIALTPDGGIFAALDEGSRGAVIAKLLPNGAMDRGFGSEGGIVLYKKVGVISATDVVADADGRLVGVGWDGGISIYRLQGDGGLDRTFNNGRVVSVEIGGSQEAASAVALQSSGRIVALGESTCCGAAISLIRLVGGTDRSRCMKRKATIVGTQGPDELIGTPRRDVIVALGGKDKVRGLTGPDLICGGRGKDQLLGGPGRDKVRQ